MTPNQPTIGGRLCAPFAWAIPVTKLCGTLAITFFGLLLLTFLIGRVVPVDPVLAVVGDRASQSTYDAAFIELGLDKPVYEQFWIYLQKAVVGDFGTSMLTKKISPKTSNACFPLPLS